MTKTCEVNIGFLSLYNLKHKPRLCFRISLIFVRKMVIYSKDAVKMTHQKSCL